MKRTHHTILTSTFNRSMKRFKTLKAQERNTTDITKSSSNLSPIGSTRSNQKRE